jgi:glycosyltransferase involved in cell wall biosynthesis
LHYRTKDIDVSRQHFYRQSRELAVHPIVLEFTLASANHQMKALYINQLSGNPERLQQRNDRTIMGAKMFEWSLLRALLKYGTYDTYFAPGLTDQKKDELVASGLTAHSIRRLAPIPLGRPLPVKDSDQVVLVIAGRELNILATLRQKLRRYDAPVCGFIHSINSARIAVALLQQCFAGLSESDLLFCSSRAGMKTIDVYIEEISRLLPADVHYAARRALVPLGVEVPTVEQQASGTLRLRLNIGPRYSIALYFGRLSQTSKCDLGPLLVALSHVLSRGNSLHLVIAGDDTQTKEAPRLRALASELGCFKNVTIWPNPSAADKHLLYCGADIFVSPSDNIQETYGLTVAEAMAYGLPAVVSDWDGYRDLVRDGENGFLIPSIFPPSIETLRLCDSTTSMLEEDSLAQSTAIDVSILSERLEKLALDQALRRQMGHAAKRNVEKHCSWRVVVKRYEELWEESLQIARAVNSDCKTHSKLLNLSLEKSFGHYATAKRSHECKCFITAEGREWLRQPARLYFLCHLSAIPCPRKFVDMLCEISDRPGLSVAKVVQSFFNDSDPASVADAHWTLARLFKYGLLADKQDNPAVLTSSAPK